MCVCVKWKWLTNGKPWKWLCEIQKVEFVYVLLSFKASDKYMEPDGVDTKIQTETFKSMYFMVLIKMLMLIT